MGKKKCLKFTSQFFFHCVWLANTDPIKTRDVFFWKNRGHQRPGFGLHRVHLDQILLQGDAVGHALVVLVATVHDPEAPRSGSGLGQPMELSWHQRVQCCHRRTPARSPEHWGLDPWLCENVWSFIQNISSTVHGIRIQNTSNVGEKNWFYMTIYHRKLLSCQPFVPILSCKLSMRIPPPQTNTAPCVVRASSTCRHAPCRWVRNWSAGNLPFVTDQLTVAINLYKLNVEAKAVQQKSITLQKSPANVTEANLMKKKTLRPACSLWNCHQAQSSLMAAVAYGAICQAESKQTN